MRARLALLVEDDPGLQATIERQLVAMRFDVLTSLDYRAAIRHLDTATPDVVCVDLGLPNESGYDLCEHIRREPRVAWVPILLTSERCTPEDMARAEEAGANVFLGKPFSPARLSASIEMLLGDGSVKSQRWMRRLRCL